MDGKANMDAVVAYMKKCDVDSWMSGLVCGINPVCTKEFAIIMDEGTTQKESDGNGSKVGDHLKDKYLGGGMGAREGCPPDCGCDNPWPFLS